MKQNDAQVLSRFSLQNDRCEARIRFLTEEPVLFYEHIVKSAGNRFSTRRCTGEGCLACADNDRPYFKCAWIIYDMSPFSRKDKGGKERNFPNGSIRLFVFGTKVSSVLDRLSMKYGLTNRVYTITRDGKGQNTNYSFERGEEDGGLSEKEIIDLIPDAMRAAYDGSEESLKRMIKDQL
jgi:hypothetical protein